MMTRQSLFRALMLVSLPLALTGAQDATPSLLGTVTDSIRRRPLVGATVVASRTDGHDSAEGRDYTATTDARGRYAFNSLPSGMYVVTVEHPWLDSTGLGVPAQKVDLVKQTTAVASLAVPSATTIRALFCPISGRDTTLGLVAGYVTDTHSGHPVAGAHVVFQWSDFSVDRRTALASTNERMVAAVTARDGTFRICGLPVMRTILVQAQIGDHQATGAVEVEVPLSGILVQTLHIDASATGATSLTGAVLRSGSQRAISGAHVHLYGATGEVLTAPDGSFVLTNVPFGTQSIEVTALGFYPRRYAIDVRSSGMGKVAISMLEMAVVLDSIKIVAKATLHREFDQRSAHGAGQYITEEMIAKADVLETAELMQQVSGFYVMSDSVYSSRGVTEIGATANHVCQPAVYIDGNPSAGSMNDITPSAIHGIEVYASSINVPAQYKSSSCGAILIWTK